MHFYAIKHDLSFAPIFNNLQSGSLNGSQNHYINIPKIGLKRRMN